ncbi:beta-galactosidase [Rhodococcus cerastii]|uniref:Beta-galactosidase n=1 Tax=Rhodococcus cerastii TaxID=908616 RepID=A0ABU4D0S9_9NOCA|nr:beta-galactosidase [Rhodococcus cerastii]MDV6302914.1 beta-galactosidase [Rhodococcus cerastii]
MDTARRSTWPTQGISFGGDYNPEQWPEDVWRRDVELMHEAGVDFVTVGVFSWARLQPTATTWDFEWLDRVMDLMHEGDIRVDLATATASPPPWLATAYPQMRPVDDRGYRYAIGSRQTWSPSSAVYREHSLVLVEKIAHRYGEHPALAMWHVSNELGCHNALCYSDDSAHAFREWLSARYIDLETLNTAWGTDFWSQRYSDWEEIVPPSVSTTFGNPTHQLDWRRFCSDALLEQYRAEKAVLNRITPDVPVTTNFMVGMGQGPALAGNMDYASWAPEQDIVSTDHYLVGPETGDGAAHHKLSFSADLTRGVAGRRPWLLMEHSTSAVNWQHINRAKVPGEMMRNSLAHMARGADGIAYFQFRASKAGAEKFHSALVPHAGEDSARWREVVELGAALRRMAPVAGSTVDARVAVLFDWASQWACEQEGHPSMAMQPMEIARRAHHGFTSAGVTCDVVPSSMDLSDYDVIVVPALYLCSDETAARIADAAEAGAQVLVTAFSGIADEDDHVRLGGYPGAFRELLGVRVEEFFPLAEGETLSLDDETVGEIWSEYLTASEDVDVLARHTQGHLRGVPALTKRTVGTGAAWYAATVPDADGWVALTDKLCGAAGIETRRDLGSDVEIVRRSAGEQSWLFVLNHGSDKVSVPATGTDLVSGAHVDGELIVAAGGSAVIAENS